MTHEDSPADCVAVLVGSQRAQNAGIIVRSPGTAFRVVPVCEQAVWWSVGLVLILMGRRTDLPSTSMRADAATTFAAVCGAMRLAGIGFLGPRDRPPPKHGPSDPAPDMVSTGRLDGDPLSEHGEARRQGRPARCLPGHRPVA